MNKLVVLLLLAGVANAETFNCQAGTIWYPEGKIVLVATTRTEDVDATIKVVGTTNRALYQVKGVNRRWDWDMRDDFGYNYAFILMPDNSAYFLDFSNVKMGVDVTATQYFVCR